MTRTVTRRTPGLSINARTTKLMEWLNLKAESDATTRSMNKIRDELQAAAEADGEPDEKGSLFLEVKPFYFNGKTYEAIKRQRRVSISFNEFEALKLAEKKGVRDRVVRTIEVIDQDEFYVLNQEDVITDKELDKLLTEKVTWAFLPVTD